MTAVLFSLTELDTGRPLGEAVIAPEVRYIGVLGRGAARIDHRFATITTWKLLEAELGPGLEAAPFPRDSAVAQVLAGGSSFTMIQYVTERMITVGPAEIAVVMDTWLREAHT